MADWGRKRDGRALGFAYLDYSGSQVAGIAEVSVDRASGQIKVHDFWCTIDCGVAVQPDNVAAQTESSTRSRPVVPAPDPAREALVRVVRDEGRWVLATLVRTVGDVGLAEDAVQDAVVRALQTCPRDGVPASPRAWLTVTARRRAVDILRRERGRGAREAAAMELLDPAGDVPPPDSVVRDDLLRLVFTCCHPSLSLEAQVALSLRNLCGLSTAEVARALLVPSRPWSSA